MSSADNTASPLLRSLAPYETTLGCITTKSVRHAHRSQSIRSKRAQTELQHNSVISDRSRHRRVGIAAEPVNRQHEAIVDIAYAKPRLVETIILDVIAR